MNAQEELKELKEKIIELEERIKAEQESSFPKDGDKYWYVSITGFVLDGDYDAENSVFEHFLYEVGNMFKTKEEAEFVAEKLKVEAELRRFSRPFAWGGENWILSMGTNKDVFLVYEDDEMSQGAFYFEDEYKAVEAIETVGKERIKKYIFGVRE